VDAYLPSILCAREITEMISLEPGHSQIPQSAASACRPFPPRLVVLAEGQVPRLPPRYWADAIQALPHALLQLRHLRTGRPMVGLAALECVFPGSRDHCRSPPSSTHQRAGLLYAKYGLGSS